MTNDVPFVDLRYQTELVRAQALEGIDAVVNGCDFILGESVHEFERAYASYVGVRYCVGVGNGTDALEIAIRSLDLPPGSEVLVPANSFVASALSVMRAGHTVRFVDPAPDNLLVTAEEFALRLTPKTRIMMPVHLYGQLVPMEPILALAQEVGAYVVEDAAQSHGARDNGRHAGTWGHLAATSFYPGKNLGAWGDGGAVLTNDHQLAERAERLRNYGSTVKYHHDEIGFNSRLDSIQAAVLSAKLPFLDEWNEARRRLATRYCGAFDAVSAVTMLRRDLTERDVYHLYVIAVDNREQVVQGLRQLGINSAIHYPIPIPRQEAFSDHSDATTSFPVADETAGRILSLPIYPGMTEEQCDRVGEAVSSLAAN
jgi:dTDP-4-amino-4,6-dideoxygalactose transaminase